MKRFVIAVALACVLSGAALAGDVHTAGDPAPAPGDIHSTGDPSPAAQSSSIAATVILAILSLVR